jgi:hypothetical protein
MRLHKLVESGVTRHFPKPETSVVNSWPGGDEVKQHQDKYRSLFKEIRMKWTIRGTPQFMLEVADPVLCPMCQAPKPKTVSCGIKACPYSDPYSAPVPF